MAFASNKNAYGICDITGFRYKRKDMKKTWDGLIVGPDQWDAKHPQLQPSAPPSEPEAIKDARPDPNDTYEDKHFNHCLFPLLYNDHIDL